MGILTPDELADLGKEEYERIVPKWEDADRVHDWRNHVSLKIMELWETFNAEQQHAIKDQAQTEADIEEWD